MYAAAPAEIRVKNVLTYEITLPMKDTGWEFTLYVVEPSLLTKERLAPTYCAVANEPSSLGGVPRPV